MRYLVKLIFILAAVLIILCSCTKTKIETVYKPVYPNMPNISYPQTLRTEICQFKSVEYGDVIVGYDKENLKCHIYNQEVYQKQIRLYQQVIDTVNKERTEWRNKK